MGGGWRQGRRVKERGEEKGEKGSKESKEAKVQ